ncbi:hypothetical protein H1C71_000498 [Ictidomys tridecemlineatus]|nr:hypothetical protein H1C71_000498 [Ictidomys tridecemlineatus]
MLETNLPWVKETIYIQTPPCHRSEPEWSPSEKACCLRFTPCTLTSACRAGRVPGLRCSPSPTPTCPPLCCCLPSRPTTSAAGQRACAWERGRPRENTTVFTARAYLRPPLHPGGPSQQPTPPPLARRSLPPASWGRRCRNPQPRAGRPGPKVAMCKPNCDGAAWNARTARACSCPTSCAGSCGECTARTRAPTCASPTAAASSCCRRRRRSASRSTGWRGAYCAGPIAVTAAAQPGKPRSAAVPRRGRA